MDAVVDPPQAGQDGQGCTQVRCYHAVPECSSLIHLTESELPGCSVKYHHLENTGAIIPVVSDGPRFSYTSGNNQWDPRVLPSGISVDVSEKGGCDLRCVTVDYREESVGRRPAETVKGPTVCCGWNMGQDQCVVAKVIFQKVGLALQKHTIRGIYADEAPFSCVDDLSGRSEMTYEGFQRPVVIARYRGQQGRIATDGGYKVPVLPGSSVDGQIARDEEQVRSVLVPYVLQQGGRVFPPTVAACRICKYRDGPYFAEF